MKSPIVLVLIVISFSVGIGLGNTFLRLPSFANSPTLGISAPKIGDKVVVGELQYIVLSMNTTSRLGNPIPFLAKGETEGVFVIVKLTVENIRGETKTFHPSLMVKVKDSQSRVYEADSSARFYLRDSIENYSELRPGFPIKGSLVFDIPRNAGRISLLVFEGSSIGSRPATRTIDLGVIG